VRPVKQAEEEFDEKVDVLRTQLVTLTRLGLVSECYFVVLNEDQQAGSWARCTKLIRTT